MNKQATTRYSGLTFDRYLEKVEKADFWPLTTAEEFEAARLMMEDVVMAELAGHLDDEQYDRLSTAFLCRIARAWRQM